MIWCLSLWEYEGEPMKNKIKQILKKIYKIKDENWNEHLISIEKEKDVFTTYWERPKYISDISVFDKGYSSQEIAILLQGQIISENHFTLETVKLYSYYYPECPIIVSTWLNENEIELKAIKRIPNVHIVLSEVPKISGPGHVNYQRKNSLEGILLAKKMNCKYVLKSRTDQRMYANDSIQYLKRLIDCFPLKINADAKGRIAACNLSTIKNRLYNICDMLLFGFTEDMEKYFSPKEAADLHDNVFLPDEFDNPVEYAKLRKGEIYFATHYIEACGFELKWTFEDSDYYRNQLFIIFDSESVDQFWPKYNRKEYKWRRYNTEKYDLATFKDWFINQS